MPWVLEPLGYIARFYATEQLAKERGDYQIHTTVLMNGKTDAYIQGFDQPISASQWRELGAEFARHGIERAEAHRHGRRMILACISRDCNETGQKCKDVACPFYSPELHNNY